MDKKIIINIGRQVCAGGLEIGKLSLSLNF